MVAVVRKYVREEITYYEIRGALPGGERYHDRVGFSLGELKFRGIVAKRIRTMRGEYLAAVRLADAELRKAMPTPAWIRQLVF